MFCPNCGTQIQEGSQFCHSCGCRIGEPQIRPQAQAQPKPQAQTQPIPQAQQPNMQYQENQYRQNPYQAQQGSYGTQPAKKPVNKKPFIIGGVIAAAAVAIVLILVFVVIKPFGGGNTATPQGTVRKLEAAFNDLDVEGIIACFDSSTRAQFDGISSELEAVSEAKTYIDMLGAEFEVHITLNESSLEYYSSNGKELCDGDLDMSYSVSVLGQQQSDSMSQSVTFVKENGQWLFYGGDAADDIMGALF